jgi:magnesium transporter
MPKLMKKFSKTKGFAPGTLIHVGEKKIDKLRISVFDYNEEGYEERDVKSIEECLTFKDSSTVTWINIDGIHDVETIEKIGKKFDLHPLTLEDVVNTAQRPKIEDFENYVFIVMKMLYHDSAGQEILIEQVSLILGPNYVISFQEREGDVFNPVRDRIRKNKGKVRKMGPDYLAYALLDAIVDNYFVVLEKIGEKIEVAEELLVKNPTPETLKMIHSLKRDMIFLRKSVWPLRELINGLKREDVRLVKEATQIYLSDVYDHTIQVIDTVETFRDMVSGMLDIYLSSLSNRMNEVMKVLTIFASIFIPLTFIAGVYGMNFKYMPELEWHWAYFIVLGIMASVGGVMLLFFKRKRWL